MAKVLQTFLSFKYFQDAAGVNYLIVNSSGENPVISLTPSGSIRVSSETRQVLRDGTNEIVQTYTGSGDVTALFNNKATTQISIVEPSSAEALSVPFGSLQRSFSFNVASGSDTGYDISDALYYDKTVHKQLVIFPESRNPHLDTSSRTDFYYLSSGNTAYIASSDLQNQFLNSIKYSNKGSETGNLGKVRGGFDDNSSLLFTCTPEITGTSQPKVRGGIVSVAMQPRDLIQNSVCLDPTASNYYLTGCVNEQLPCTDSGVTHADDCDGIALTSQRLNNYVNVNGGCCEYTTGCDGYAVSIGAQTPADTDTANGTIDVTVTNGTTNYSATIQAISLDNSTLTYTTNTVNSISTDTFTISSLFPGTYSISVTDSTSGTACTAESSFTIREDISDVDGSYGCKTTSSAINYDNSVSTHYNDACVFCNSTTGLLEAGSGRFLQTLGPAFVELPGGSPNTAATSDPAGTSLSDGAITFAGFDFAGSYNVLPAPNNLDFNPASEFTTSNQASPIDYRLYKTNTFISPATVQAYIDGGQSGLTFIANNSTLVTTVATTGGAYTFTGLAAGNYYVVAVYDNDGTQDGDDEVEQCYTISSYIGVAQSGCTNGDAPNFNSDATVDDGSCFVEGETESCEPTLRFGLEASCSPQYGIVDIKFTNFFATNPFAFDAGVNGFTVDGGYYNGQFVPGGIANSPTSLDFAGRRAAAKYVWFNVLCYGLFNPNENDGVNLTGAMGLLSGAQGDFNTAGGSMGGGGYGQDYTHGLIIEHAVVMGDGTLYSSGNNSLRDFFVNPNITISTNWICDAIQLHGAPQGVQVSYNYGELNVYSENVTEFIPFTPAQQASMDTCCLTEEPETPGCTDPQADNYNPAATIDDGTCDYPEPDDILGCTDVTANNYNPLATIDDGSCEYGNAGSWFVKICNVCDFEPNDSNGYATEAECLLASVNESDCCLLEEYQSTGNVTFSSGGSTSTYNSTTELCDDDSTGSIAFNLPNATSLLSNITNPNGVAYIWVVQHNAGQFMYGSWFTGQISMTGFIPPYGNNPPYDILTANTQIVLTNVPSGAYTLSVALFDSAFLNTNGNIDIPSTTSLSLLGQCAQLSGTGTVALENCDDGGGGPTNIHGCLDPTATNYLVNCAGVSVPNANVDDGCCEFVDDPPPNGCLCSDIAGGLYDPSCCPPNPSCGCMDPNALNYNPNANYQDGTCPCEYEYNGCIEDCDGVTTTMPGCVPKGIKRLLDYNAECIARAGNRFYTKHITGLGSDCSNMETWKMIIIQDLMSRQGLPCIYNCADPSTPSLEFAETSCKDNWISAGSQFWSPSNASSFTIGSYVRRPYTPNPNNLPAPYYVAISNTGLDVDPFANDPESGWKKCITYQILDETEDYLQNFLSFAKEYCKDCGIPAYRQRTSSNSSVIGGFNVGGTSVTVNGATFDDVADQSDLTGPLGSTDDSDEIAGEDDFAGLS
jgi:hypothetical protein